MVTVLPRRSQTLHLVLYLLAFFAVWSLRATLLYRVDDSIISPAWRQVYGNGVRLLLWVVPALLYVGLVDRANPFRYLGLTGPFRWKAWLQAGAIVVIYFSVGMFGEYLVSAKRTVSFDTAPWPWYQVLWLLIVPLAEETLFRGFLLRKWRELLPFWPANVVTAALFTAIHWPYWLYSQGWNTSLLFTSTTIFLLAVLLGYLVKKTESLWPSILTHTLNNLISSMIRIG